MIKCILLILLTIKIIHSAGDTVRSDTCKVLSGDTIKREHQRQLFLTTQFNQIKNFHSKTNINADFTGKFNSVKKKHSGRNTSKQEFIAEICFTKYLDSIIVVTSDLLEFTGNWQYKGLSVLNTLNVNVKTQLTNSYDYFYYNNAFGKALSTQPLLPITINIGYGFNFSFKNNNYINVSLIDIKAKLISENSKFQYLKSQKFTKKLRSIPVVGLSLNSSIYKSWMKATVSWKSSSKIFAKGFTKDDITIDFKNRIMYEIYKSINVSFENQIVYDPLINYNLQLKNEVIIGVLFRNKEEVNNGK